MLLSDCRKTDPAFHGFVHRLMTECGPIIQRHTVAFFDEDMLVQRQGGTGVLLTVGDRHFILTAAHVLDLYAERGLPMFIMPEHKGAKLVSLDGAVMYRSEMPDSRDRLDDPMDVGFVEIMPGIVAELAPSKTFLTLDGVDLRDPFHSKSWYMTVGYPYEVNESDHERRRHDSTLFAYASWPYCGERGSPSAYRPGFDLLVHFARDDSTEGDENVLAYVPEPPGISGCGMWRLAAADKPIEQWSPADIRLVGIQHSWFADIQALRGVRIIHPLEMMAFSIPQLHPEFKKCGL